MFERGHSVVTAAGKLGVSTKSLYDWAKRYDSKGARRSKVADEVKRLRADLKRVTEGRDILKRPPRTLPRSRDKVRVHSGASR